MCSVLTLLRDCKQEGTSYNCVRASSINVRDIYEMNCDQIVKYDSNPEIVNIDVVLGSSRYLGYFIH